MFWSAVSQSAFARDFMQCAINSLVNSAILNNSILFMSADNVMVNKSLLLFFFFRILIVPQIFIVHARVQQISH